MVSRTKSNCLQVGSNGTNHTLQVEWVCVCCVRVPPYGMFVYLSVDIPYLLFLDESTKKILLPSTAVRTFVRPLKKKRDKSKIPVEKKIYTQVPAGLEFPLNYLLDWH